MVLCFAMILEPDFTLGFRGFAYLVPKTASRVHVHISRRDGHVVGSVKHFQLHFSMSPKIEKPKTQQSFAAGCSPGGIPLRGYARYVYNRCVIW